METFVTAYLIVWLGLLLFVGRMQSRQRRLQSAIDSLESRLSKQADEKSVPIKAA